MTILVDRSGSMRSIQREMELALRTLISEHRAVPSTRVTLIEFDDIDDQHVLFQNCPVTSVENIRLSPRGNTPLLDAMCRAIDGTGRRLSAMLKRDRPDQVLFIVITDGQENASREFKRHDVFDRVTKQRDTYNWQFIYLGANQDAFSEAATLGIQPNWTLNYSTSPMAMAGATRGLVSNTVAYASAGEGSRSKSVSNFTDEQRTAALDPNSPEGIAERWQKLGRSSGTSTLPGGTTSTTSTT